MAKSGIKFFYLSGGPENIIGINCLNSSPYLSGTIVLTPFINLSSFQGGDNNLEAVTGFSNLTALKTFEITGTNTVGFDINTLPVNLQRVNIQGLNKLSGNYTSLPSSLTYFNVQGGNTITGDVTNLPRGLVHYEHTGTGSKTGTLNTLPSGLRIIITDRGGGGGFTGNISGIPLSAEVFDIRSANSITGDLSGIPNTGFLQIFDIRSANTLFGSISGIPGSVTSFRGWGNNTITGNLSTLKEGLTGFDALGSNTVFGNIENIPNSLQRMIVRGQNNIIGNVENFSPSSNLKILRLTSGGTGIASVSGNVSGLPRVMQEIEMGGRHYLSGDVIGLPPNLEILDITGTALGVISGTFSSLPSTLKTMIVTNSPGYTLSGSIEQLPSTMEVFRRFMSTTLVGDISGAPRTLRNFLARGGPLNVITGDIQYLPPNIEIFDAAATGNANTIYGNIANLPQTLNSFSLGGANTITGDIATLSQKYTGGFLVQGQNTIDGDYSNLPRLMSGGFRLIGQNAAVGSIDRLPVSLQLFDVRGGAGLASQRTGDIKNLPTVMHTFRIGENTLTGDISSLKPGLEYFRVIGSFSNNTITGDVGLLPSSLRSFEVRENNTIYGNLSTIPANINHIRIVGSGQVYSYYDGTEGRGYFKRAWQSPMRQVQLQPGLKNGSTAGMPQEHLVTLLVDLSAVDWQGAITINPNISGDGFEVGTESGEPRLFTANVNNPAIFSALYPEVSAAITAIQSKGTTVTVNLISATPSFYRNFARYKTLDHGGTLSGAPITFTRNSSATYFDSNGVLQYANIDEPRFDHDPITKESKGLLIERTSVNLLTGSDDLQPQSLSLLAGSYTLSFYSTGNVILTDVHTATVGGNGLLPVRTIYNFDLQNSGTLNISKTGTILYAQLEDISFPTSYIPTTTVSATRIQDSAQVLDVTSFFNQPAGTLLGSGYAPVPTSGSPDTIHRRLVEFVNSGGTQENLISFGRGGQNIIRFAINPNTLASSITRLSAANIFNNTDYFRGAFGYEQNNMTAFANSVQATPMLGLSGSDLPTSIQIMNIGRGVSNPTRWLNGHVESIMYLPSYFTVQQLRDITI